MSILFYANASAAASFSVDGIYYNVLKNGTTCEVTNSLGGSKISKPTTTTTSDETLKIPASVTYNGTTYSVTQIGKFAFEYGYDFAYIELPGTITSIGNSAFRYNQTLKSISIPSGVKSIGDYVFEGCPNLESVSIPASLTSFGGNDFTSCPKLSSLTIDEGNTVYDSRNNCNAIVYTKYNTVMYGCNSSTIPEGIVAIADAAFYECTGLKSISFPSTLTSIGEQSFCGCTSLSSIFISAGLTDIGDEAFNDCPNIESIAVDSNNKLYDSRNDCNALIETASNTLIMGCGKTVIPEGVVTIGASAFDGCKVLTSITLPNTVKTIGYNAFGFSSIQTFDGGNSLVTISDQAFEYCTNLKSVTVPSTLTSIGMRAFIGCQSLTDFINYSKTPQTINKTFDSTPDEKYLHVCSGCSSTYKGTSGWSDFIIVEDLESADIILQDGEPYTETEKQYSQTIRYVRNYQNTCWQALYIPFSLAYDDWCKNFEVAYINAFHSYDTDGDGEFDKVQLEVCRVKKGYLIPNNPYLIKAKAVGEQTLTASNATLYPAEENSLDCSSVSNKYIFTGTYSAIGGLNTFGCFFMSGGALCSTTNAEAVLSPYRWYMKTESRGSQSSATAFAKNVSFTMVFVGEEDEATSLEECVAFSSPADNYIYDLSGRLMNTSDINNLPKGIYVVNKHKFVKK